MGLFKFIKEAIQEGVNEAKEEMAAEKRQYQDIKEAPVSVEKKMVAYACPLREVLISSSLAGSKPHLYKLGMLDDREKKSVRELLIRDFDIHNAQDVKEKAIALSFSSLITQLESAGDEDGSSVKLALTSIQLYIYAAAVDVEYVTFSEIESDALKMIDKIENECGVDSWAAFAEAFTQGERVLQLNNSLGQRVIQSRIKWLLEDEESPWSAMTWAA